MTQGWWEGKYHTLYDGPDFNRAEIMAHKSYHTKYYYPIRIIEITTNQTVVYHSKEKK